MRCRIRQSNVWDVRPRPRATARDEHCGMRATVSTHAETSARPRRVAMADVSRTEGGRQARPRQ
eukprot:14949234-Alexandrium_andersonii.AAC.1